ncbi:MAG: phenylalanine--tRNA ligase subunit alpha [Gammaproteobacteria bacterium]|jgi:phenylalanyl-tRNA synthetase alpha chain|nr:phenylalanine--tRNA ligase subunit alpha [Gammaproteobacteria bacterium]MBT7603974.1 phenylalanine--tRNA ligase subunit alpha [Gammaproteobacteria bacterium]
MSGDSQKQDLSKVLEEAEKLIKDTKNLSDLDKIRVQFLGKKSLIMGLMKTLSSVEIEKRAAQGEQLNNIKEKINFLLSSKKSELNKNSNKDKDQFDVTMPGKASAIGSLHPITKTMNYAIQIFESLKFECVEGPEIEDEFHNFTALNIPDYHPARAMHDTFYLENSFLLRTHTSSVQVRVMDEKEPPIRIIAPGKVYRKDSDITHTPMFHQIEGLYIDKKVSFSNLKGIISVFLKIFFEKDDLKIRFRPSYFPFTEPSAEVDIEYLDSKGNKQWLEILGCGMVHPNVLEMANINPDDYSGYAFGLGVERLAMLKLGITDLRLFYENDLRFLKQFQRK